LDALPYADADRLVHVFGPLSAGTVAEIRQRQRSFESIAAFTPFVDDAVYGSEDGPRSAQIAWVEPEFFHALAVSPVRARTFKDNETASGLVPLSGGLLGSDTARVVVMTHAAWQRFFASSPGALGRHVRINGMARTVVGVLPPGFVGPMGAADFFLPFDLGPVVAVSRAVRRSTATSPGRRRRRRSHERSYGGPESRRPPHRRRAAEGGAARRAGGRSP